MQNKHIGVFMRVYRNEKSMHRAIQSVLDQTYSNFTYYILVNSQTKKTAMHYACKDARIRLFDGEPEDGFSLYAKRIAEETDYLTTIDADDWYEATYLEKLLNCIEANQLDIVACGNYFTDFHGKRISERRSIEIVWNVQDTARILLEIYSFFRPIWGKLVRSTVYMNWDPSILPQSNSYGGYGGDTMLIFSLFPFAKRAGICGQILYNYRISPSGGSYALKPGRLDSDAIVFRFVEKILSELGPVDERAVRFLYHVYACALRDTSKLLIRYPKMAEEDRAKKLLYIYRCDLTRHLLARLAIGTLDIPQLQKEDYRTEYYTLIFSSRISQICCKKSSICYLKILEILYPHLKGALTPPEFVLLTRKEGLLRWLCLSQYHDLFDGLLFLLKEDADIDAEICLQLLRRTASSEVLKPFLQEKSFVAEYSNIFQAANHTDWDKAFKILQEIFEEDSIGKDAEELIELWISLAAFLENAGLFVVGKEMKVEILLDVGKVAEAMKEHEELSRLGVDDENMKILADRMKV